MTRPLCQAARPVRVLEVGPGTGAVTRKIVTLLRPEDRFDLVELNETFAGLLQKRFAEHPDYMRAAAQSQIHICPIQDFPYSAPYDIIISGLPLNNFPCDLVRRIFDVFFQLLVPGGTLSYFEYMYVRSFKRRLSNGAEKARLTELDEILLQNIRQYRIRRDWVFANFPPAWVQHLRAPE